MAGLTALDHFLLHGARQIVGPEVRIRRATVVPGNALAILDRLRLEEETDAERACGRQPWWADRIKAGQARSGRFRAHVESVRRRTALRKLAIVAIVLRRPGISSGRLYHAYVAAHGSWSYSRFWAVMEELQDDDVVVGRQDPHCRSRTWRIARTNEEANFGGK